MKTLIIAFLALGIAMAFLAPQVTEDVTGVEIPAGVRVYLPVKRKVIQAQLDKAEGPRLFMPGHTVLPNQEYGTHPLLVDIAHVTSLDLDTSSVEITISIPFLKAAHSYHTDYSLGVVVLTDRNGIDGAKSNFLYEYQEVDRIYFSNDRLEVAELNGDQILIGFKGQPGSCRPATYDFSDDIFTIKGQPSFDYCFQNRPTNPAFCRFVRDLFPHLNDDAPNVCLGWKTHDERVCGSTAELSQATGKFHGLFGVDTPVEALEAQWYSGSYTIAVKTPCVYQRYPYQYHYRG